MSSLNKSEGKNRKKSVLIGLDGVPHSMLLEILTDQAYGTMIRSH